VIDRRSLAAAPAALLAVLLLAATFYEGAFDIRHWAPVAIFALVLLVALRLGHATRPVGCPIQVALAAIWAFAGWSLLSVIWAESEAMALEGGALAVLYAALATVGLLAVPGPRQMRAIGYALVGGVALFAVVTLVRMHTEGAELFIAGRLDSPVGYRNATAALFALAFWPLIGLAVTRGRNPTLRALAFSIAVLCLGLGFLTQSRGVIVGLAAGGVVALVLSTERVRRAFLALLALAGVLVLSGPLLVAYRTFEDGPGPVTASDVESATNALTFLVVDALIIGLLLALLDGGLRASVENLDRARRIAAVGLAVGAVGLITGGVLAAGNPIDFAREKLDEFQAVESRSSDFSRIISTGGQRYDLWRVAFEEFAGAPIVGVGEGNYERAYYAGRDTDRNLSNPHSLPLRLLAELGVVGAALFITFLAALGLALVRGVRGQPLHVRHAVAGFAAAGAVALGQATVDWIWLVPGVMGIGILSLALAAGSVSPLRAVAPARVVAPAPGRAELGSRGTGGGIRGGALAAGRTAVVGLRQGLPVAGLLTAALLVLAIFLSDFYVREARTAVTPGSAVSAARQAEDLNPWALPPRYLQARALEDQGEIEAAREALEGALALEPSNFATIGLLGDLEQRAGNAEPALRNYREAAALNPRDVGLEQLVEQARRDAHPDGGEGDGAQASVDEARPGAAEGSSG
jgi:hypothetical protein